MKMFETKARRLNLFNFQLGPLGMGKGHGSGLAAAFVFIEYLFPIGRNQKNLATEDF